MELLRSTVLSVINDAAKFSNLAETKDEHALLVAGLFPKRLLYAQFPGQKELVTSRVASLIEDNYLIETESFYLVNPKNRTRPVATRYDSAKPTIRRNVAPMSYRMFRRDRLLLWYAAANEDFSGSRGERYGLWDVLQFFRTKPVQKLWRKYKQRPRWKIPKDAL